MEFHMLWKPVFWWVLVPLDYFKNKTLGGLAVSEFLCIVKVSGFQHLSSKMFVFFFFSDCVSSENKVCFHKPFFVFFFFFGLFQKTFLNLFCPKNIIWFDAWVWKYFFGFCIHANALCQGRVFNRKANVLCLQSI